MMNVRLFARARNDGDDPLRTTSATKFGTAGVSIKTALGRHYWSCISNYGASDVTFMVFDKASAPVNGDTPIARLIVKAGTSMYLDHGPFGLACALGIGIAVSTLASPDTLTLPATSDVHHTTQWK